MLKYERCFPEEFVSEVNKCPVVYFPLGALEWHGWHLPFGNDSIKAYEICIKVAEKVGGVVLPPLYFGTDFSAQKRENSMYGMDIKSGQILPGSCYYLRPDVYKRIIEQIANNLIRQGFKIIVLLAGHYPRVQREILCDIKNNVEKNQGIHVLAYAEFELLNDHEYKGDHAGKWETSILMDLKPELVKIDRFEAHKKNGDHLLGVDGNPEQSSPHLGEAVIQMTVQNLITEVESLLHNI